MSSSHLKQQGAVLLQANSLAVRQCHQPVIIHHRVHVLYPQCINVTVEQDVPQLRLIRWQRSVDLTEDV